jgi:hypothetical protein
MADMDLDRINEAALQCVRKCLSGDQPLVELHISMVVLKGDGWSDGDIQAVKSKAIRMLSVIYDLGTDSAN